MNAKRVLLESRTWPDFTGRLRKLSRKQRGDCFEALAACYFQLHPTYATKVRQVWPLRDVPAEISNHLNLPSPDEGIDLVAQTLEGDYWAIQCKFRENESESLSRRELATFTDLAFGICRNIRLGLVCTTADRLSRKFGLYGDKVSFICGDRWRELDSEFFQRLHRLIEGKVALPNPLTPRPHQLRAIQNAETHFGEDQNDRGKLIMPCGAGKSLTAYWIAERLGAHSVLIAVPSLALIRQTLEVWARESLANQRDIRWICVCSDTTVAEAQEEDVAVLSQDLGVQVHTDPEEIAQWLSQHDDGVKVVIATYQSGKSLSEAVSKAGFVFDLGILDEAHKTVGRRHSLFSHLLHDHNIKIRKRIFMTATERRYLGQSEQIASMNDPELYGDTFELLTFKAALDEHPPILSDCTIVTIVVRSAEVRELIRKNVFVRPDRGSWDEDVEAEMLAAAVALRRAMLKHPIRHAVSFHASIARAKAFKYTQDNLTDSLPDYGPLSTFHVSGAMPTATRKRQMDTFEAAQRALMTNARCLTEGVDVPNIDCVLFADPRRSTIDIVQAVGRALRPADGKERGYVIVPVLANDGEGADALLESGAFDAVLTTLRALAANDDRIVEYFRSVSQGRRYREGRAPVLIDLPLGVQIDARAFARSIELKLWSRLARLSWRPFEEARTYVRSHGLRDVQEWRAFCKGQLPHKGGLPDDIPSWPNEAYAEKGWVSWGDWLGTGNVANYLREWLPFDEARVFARSLDLKNQAQWRAFCAGRIPKKGVLPENIPSNPWDTYSGKGWTSLGDWLGTGTVADRLRAYRPFDEASAFACGLGLASHSEWRTFCRGEMPEKGLLPQDIPAKPDATYKNKGWMGWGDWLGTGMVATRKRRYRDFEQAREFARGLGLSSEAQWRLFRSGEMPDKGTLPGSVPANPNQTYRHRGWRGWGDWLGTGTVANRFREWAPFGESREFARSLRLRSRTEWSKFCKGEMPEKGTLPEDVPTYPEKVYKDKGWIGVGDWLGTGNVGPGRRQYRSFSKAREFARGLHLKGQREWRAYCRGEIPRKGTRLKDIPADPHRLYANEGWNGYGDWLGTGTIATSKRRFRPFLEARDYARGLGLKNGNEWWSFCKGQIPERGTLPQDVPSNPHRTYKDTGWSGMGDWLGTRSVARSKQCYRSFTEAREFARSLGLRDQNEWFRFCKGEIQKKGRLPSDIPARPRWIYRDDGWISMGDWLGTGVVATFRRQYRPFEDARAYVRGLSLRNEGEWRAFLRKRLPEKGVLPADVPANPGKVYRNDGWAGIGDWLGTGVIATSRRHFRCFAEAREFSRSLGITKWSEWRAFCKGQMPERGTLPQDIPAKPYRTYRDAGWNGMADWLGTARKRK